MLGPFFLVVENIQWLLGRICIGVFRILGLVVQNEISIEWYDVERNDGLLIQIILCVPIIEKVSVFPSELVVSYLGQA